MLEDVYALLTELAAEANDAMLQVRIDELKVEPLKAWLPMIQAWKISSGADDAETVEDCLRRFKQCYKEHQMPIKDIRKSSAVVRFALQSHSPSPNNLQVAKAQAACHLLGRYGRQIWQVPGG